MGWWAKQQWDREIALTFSFFVVQFDDHVRFQNFVAWRKSHGVGGYAQTPGGLSTTQNKETVWSN